MTLNVFLLASTRFAQGASLAFVEGTVNESCHVGL